MPEPDPRLSVTKARTSDRKVGAQPLVLGVPDPPAAEQLAAIRGLHEGFAQRISTKFAAYLKTAFQADLAGDIVQSVGDVLASEPACFLWLKLRPQGAVGVLQLDHAFTFALMETLLGGKASAPAESVRGFTPLELNLLRPVFSIFVEELEDAWRSELQVSVSLESVATAADRTSGLYDQGPLLVGHFEASLGEVPGPMMLAVPRHVFQKLCQESDSGAPAASTPSAEQKAKIAGVLQPTPVRLSAELPLSNLSVRDVLSLEVDDLVVGMAGMDQPITVSVNGVSKYLAQATSQDGQRALVISERTRAELPT